MLFRDAWSQRHQDPKAALAQGVSSLEIAVKQCIVRLVPETEYLLLEIQAPPVLNLLSNYLPQLIAGKSLRLPQLPRSVIDDVKAMIHQRNLLVHKGELTIDGERVFEYLWIIHDLLYYLDFATGNKWALSLTSDEFKNWIASEMPELDLTDPLELQTSSKGVKPTD